MSESPTQTFEVPAPPNLSELVARMDVLLNEAKRIGADLAKAAARAEEWAACQRQEKRE